MNQKRNSIFEMLALLAMLSGISACSSSQVEDGEVPPETAAAVGQGDFDQAMTDEVPNLDPLAEVAAPVAEDPALAPGSLAASPDAPPAYDPIEPTLSDVPEVGYNTDSQVAMDSSMELPGNGYETVPVVETETYDSIPTYQAPAYSAPAAQAPAYVADAPADATQYRVRRGDTLMKIAFEQYGDLYRWREIYEANRGQIRDPNAVPPGTLLTLSGAGMVTVDRNGEQYLIRRGDTLGKISGTVYGTPRKWKRLWENNRQLIKDPNKIYAGFYLYYVPEGILTNESYPAPMQVEEPAVEGDYGAKSQEAAPVATIQSVDPAAPAALREPASAKAPQK